MSHSVAGEPSSAGRRAAPLEHRRLLRRRVGAAHQPARTGHRGRRGDPVPAGRSVRSPPAWPAWSGRRRPSLRQRPGPRRRRHDLRPATTAPRRPAERLTDLVDLLAACRCGEPGARGDGPIPPTRPRTASGCSRSRPGSVAAVRRHRRAPSSARRPASPADSALPGLRSVPPSTWADRAGRRGRRRRGPYPLHERDRTTSSRSASDRGRGTRRTTPATTRSCSPRATGATSSTGTATGGTRRSSPTWTSAGTASTSRSRTGSTTSTSARWSATPTPSSPPRCTSSAGGGGTGAARW